MPALPSCHLQPNSPTRISCDSFTDTNLSLYFITRSYICGEHYFSESEMFINILHDHRGERKTQIDYLINAPKRPWERNDIQQTMTNGPLPEIDHFIGKLRILNIMLPEIIAKTGWDHTVRRIQLEWHSSRDFLYLRSFVFFQCYSPKSDARPHWIQQVWKVVMKCHLRLRGEMKDQ